jgi:hypothetical protein
VQHVKLTDSTEPFRHFSQATAELAGDFTVKLENGEELAKPPGRDPGDVEGPDIIARAETG